MTVDLKMLRDGWRLAGALDNEAIELFDYCESLEAQVVARNREINEERIKVGKMVEELLQTFSASLASTRALTVEEAAALADKLYADNDGVKAELHSPPWFRGQACLGLASSIRALAKATK